MSIPRALIDCLNTNKVSYEILPHAVAFTARMAAAAEHIANHHQAEVVIVGSEKGPVMKSLGSCCEKIILPGEHLSRYRVIGGYRQGLRRYIFS